MFCRKTMLPCHILDLLRFRGQNIFGVPPQHFRYRGRERSEREVSIAKRVHGLSSDLVAAGICATPSCSKLIIRSRNDGRSDSCGFHSHPAFDQHRGEARILCAPWAGEGPPICICSSVRELHIPLNAPCQDPHMSFRNTLVQIRQSQTIKWPLALVGGLAET